MDFDKCVRCEFRYVTEKAKESFAAEGLQSGPLLCLHCIGEVTGKVLNKFGYLVPEDELEESNRMQVIPRTVAECRPCMKKRGLG